MTAELKGIHAKTFHDLDVIKDVLRLDEEKIAELEKENAELKAQLESERDLPAIAYMKKKNEEQLIKAKKNHRTTSFITLCKQ